jgi:hypothetical protein
VINELSRYVYQFLFIQQYGDIIAAFMFMLWVLLLDRLASGMNNYSEDEYYGEDW